MVTKIPIARTDVRKTTPFFQGQKRPAGPVVQPKRDAHFFQPKLTIGLADDAYEREADAVGDQVVRAENAKTKKSPVVVQTKCAACEEEERLQRKESEGQSGSPEVPAMVSRPLQSGAGVPMDTHTKSFMEHRFGYDFRDVKIHTGADAAKSAQSIHALAYTVGDSIVFGPGKYSPETAAGKKLLAHELTHVVQQKGMVQKKIQRSSADFCTPYPTATDAADAKWWLRHTYMLVEGLPTYGTEVNDLYESYLNRKSGDSLSPRVFDSEDSYIHNCFADDGAIKDDMDNVIDVVGANLARVPPPPLQDGVRSLMSLSNFMSAADMNDRPINFGNPFSVSGHIAGGVGSSDAGADYRKITSANVAITKETLIGNTGYHLIELIPDYEVFDAIDFCPGDPGSPAEQLVTTTFSRLEASNEAYDMPFKVIFSPEPRSKRFWF